MLCTVGGQNPIGLVKKYSKRFFSHNLERHNLRLSELIINAKNRLFRFKKSTLSELSLNISFLKKLLDNFAKSNSSMMPSFACDDFFNGSGTPSNLANPPPLIFFRNIFQVFLISAVVSFGAFFNITKADENISKVTLIESMYEGDSTISHRIRNQYIDCRISFKAKHEFAQVGKVSDFEYQVYITSNQKIVRLFENGTDFSVVKNGSETHLISSDENSKIQKLVFESSKPTKIIFKNRKVENYLNIKLYSDKIVFSDNFEPFEEIQISSFSNRPLVGMYFGIERNPTVPITYYPTGKFAEPVQQDSTLAGSVLHAYVYERIPGDEKSNKFVSVSGEFNHIMYAKEFMMEITPKQFKIDGNYSYPNDVWYLSDRTGRTEFVKDGRWHRAKSYPRANPPPLGVEGAPNNFTIFSFDAIQTNYINKMETMLFLIRGKPMPSGESYAVSFSWPGKDSAWTINPHGTNWDAIYRHPKDSILGCFYIGAGVQKLDKRFHDANNFLWSTIITPSENKEEKSHADSLQMEFWDNSRKLPTIGFQYTTYAYAKDTNYYHLDSIPPRITSLSLTPNDTLVDVNSKFTITFNEAVKFSSSNVKLFENGTRIMAFVDELNASSYKIYTDYPLIYKTDYVLEINSVADTSGNLMKDTLFPFSTMPNPSSVSDPLASTIKVFSLHDEIFIKSDEPFKQIKLYDMMGRVVHSESNPDGKTHSQIPTNALPSGIYYMRVDGEIHKIVVF